MASFLLDLTKRKRQNRRDWCSRPTDPHTSDCVFKNNNWKPDETNKQKMLQTRRLQAGRAKPEHKNGGGDSRSNARLVCPDYCGLTHLSVSRGGSRGPWSGSHPWSGSQCHGHKSKLSATGSSRQRLETAFTNLCFSTNRWNGLGTWITEKLLRAKQKWNEL